MEDKKYSEYKLLNEKLKLHFSYVVVILCLIIIGFITFHCFDNRDTFNAVSFCSAIVSIILAVLTIVYSYYLNSRSSGQIETLNNAAKDVSMATRTYADSASNLHNNISRIIEAVDRIEVKTDKLVDDSLRSGQNAQNSINNFDPIEYVRNYVKLSSPVGIMTMYACVLSKQKNKSFTLDIIGDDKRKMYAAGFLISTFVTGIISGNIDFNSFTVTANAFIETAKEAIEEWIEHNAENEATKELKPLIDNYFK